jgi:hypothetical protein
MTEETFRLVVAVSTAVVAASVVLVAWAVVRLVAEAHRVARRSDELVRLLDEELPPTLEAMSGAARSLQALAEAGQQPVSRADRLADEAEATMASLRALSSTIHEMLSAPAATVTGVRRSARMVGDTIAQGAGRIRRAIVREEDDEPGGG